MRKEFVPAQATRLVAWLSAIYLLSPATVRAQQERSPSGVKVAAQVVTGTVVAPVAFIAGGLATKWMARHLGADETRESQLAYVGAWTFTGLAVAGVPPLIARGGTYPAALAGTALGGAAAAAMVAAGRAMFRDTPHCGIFCTTWGIVTFALPATGATILYNRSR